MMPIRRGCARSVRESTDDLNRPKSWILALWAMVGSVSPLLALDCSTRGRTMEKAAVRWSRAALSAVPAISIGKATNFTRPQYFLRAEMRREYFCVFNASLVSHPRSLHNPISTIMMV